MFKAALLATMFAFSTSLMAQSATNPGTDAGLSDAEIAKILMTINQGEVETNRLGAEKARNPAVKDFARQMITKHDTNKQVTEALAKAVGPLPKESDQSRIIQEDTKNVSEGLKKTSNGFDRAFMRAQVDLHQKALDTIQGTLIPSAKNPQLKDHLEKTRASVQDHLKHAKSISAKL